MSLRENEHRRLHAVDVADPDEILTFREWVALNKISERTGRRILERPDGPVVTLLSTRRFGISRRANLAWQKSRERDAVTS
jgi:hypothetical protein